jgi:hypothetical protein
VIKSLFLLTMLGAVAIPAQPLRSLWVSWDVFEPDTCASVWLVKRHVDPKAVFRFLPKGMPVTEGTPFDTPDAKLRRYATLSTYESILKEFKIEDRAAVEIGVMIHEIEIDRWARKSTAQSIEVENRVRQLIAAAKNHDELTEKAIVYFDQLAAEIGKRPAGRNK